jgi:hypothetical protein
MPDKPFVINDRRKFTAEGELRPDAAPSEPKPLREEQVESSASHATEASGPKLVPSEPAAEPAAAAFAPETPQEDSVQSEVPSEEQAPLPPTAEQTDQANRAYTATVDRLDTAIRAGNPGMERMPEMSFERLVQFIYMQTLLQLGLAAEPNTTPQVDLLGARQSIDMLNIIEKKSNGNLTDAESKLISSALFEMRMGFLEMTQALARQAAARANSEAAPPTPPSGPSLIR